MKQLNTLLEHQKELNRILKRQMFLSELERLFGNYPEPLLNPKKVLLKCEEVLRTLGEIQKKQRLSKEQKNIVTVSVTLTKENIKLSKSIL